MKNRKFFWKVLTAAILVSGILFGTTSCKQTAEEVLNSITGNSTIDNLISNFKTGTYTGSVSKVKLTQNDGVVTITWENPVDDPRFERVGVYQDSDPTPIEMLDKDDEPKAVVDGLEEGKRYTFSVFAMGKEDDGSLSYTKNPWYKSIKIGAVTKYQFIGRGYNAITGEYFCYSTGLKDQIIEFDENFKPSLETVNSSDVSYSAGQTFTSYQKEFTEKAGIEGGYAGFSASVDVDFSSSEGYTEETSFASANGVNKKEREYLKSTQTSIDTLKAHLTEDFKDAINNSKISPEKIFKDYGTHVMLDTYIGGRFTVNYTYKNTERESAESITVGVKANYEGAFSAGASSETGYGTNSKMNSSNTNVSGYSRGGKSVSFASIEQAVEAWGEWNSSLDEDASTWSLIDSPETINNQDENTGVWLFADSPARQKEIRDAYLKLLEQNAESFAAKQIKKWVKAITVYDTGNGNDGTYASIRNAVRGKLGHDNFIIAGENGAENNGVGAYELNSGINKNTRVYLIMIMTTNKDEALRGIIGNSAKSASDTENVCLRNPQIDKSQWEQVTGNYRTGRGDGYRVFFTSNTQNRNGTTGEKAHPIKEIAVYNSSRPYNSASKMALRSWKAELDYGSEESTTGNNITTSSGGDDIFIRIYYDPEDVDE